MLTCPIIFRGRRQARMLIPMLAAYGVTKLISSSSTRCTATVLPYAHQRELTVDTYSLLSGGGGEDDPKGVGSLARRFEPQPSPAVSPLRSVCTGRCCRTFSLRSRLRRQPW